MDILDIYKSLNIPVLILEKSGSFVFKNQMFETLFGTNIIPNKMKIFKNSFSIESCILSSDDISDYNPIDIALKSNTDVKTFCTYQKNSEEFLYINVSVTNTDKYLVFEFINCTEQILLEDLKNKYKNINSELAELKKENTQYLTTKDKAQNQAIKMALLNRILETLKQSIDISITLPAAFKEMSEIFGFSKISYSAYNNNSYIIQNIYPAKYCAEINKKLNTDNISADVLSLDEVTITHVIPQKPDKNTAVKTQGMVICPIKHSGYNIGVINGILPLKKVDSLNLDMLNAITSQLTSAIIQANLFKELDLKNKQLEKTIKKLEETQLQLINSEKMASLGQLVAGVAHEINTPLASINANNSMYEKILNSELTNEERLEMIKSVIDTDKEAIKRISNIVKSLKRFVRLDEAELQNADINTEIDSTLEILKHETKNRIEIIKNYSKLNEIKCYPGLLNQVFMNILMNGIQSISGNGKLYITTKQNKTDLKISIKDTGCGMDEKTKEKIFKSGFTTKKIGIGTGLGLMICKDIIERHNGHISFNSEIGKGSEFIISIPINKKG